MTNEKAINYLASYHQYSPFYLLTFVNTDNGELHAYETRKLPLEAYNLILAKQPSLELLAVSNYTLESEIRKVCAMVREVRKARLSLLPKMETITISINKISQTQ